MRQKQRPWQVQSTEDWDRGWAAKNRLCDCCGSRADRAMYKSDGIILYALHYLCSDRCEATVRLKS